MPRHRNKSRRHRLDLEARQREVAYNDRVIGEHLATLGFENWEAYQGSVLWTALRNAWLESKPRCNLCWKNRATTIEFLAFHPSVLRGDRPDLVAPICDYCQVMVSFTSNQHRRLPLRKAEYLRYRLGKSERKKNRLLHRQRQKSTKAGSVWIKNKRGNLVRHWEGGIDLVIYSKSVHGGRNWHWCIQRSKDWTEYGPRQYPSFLAAKAGLAERLSVPLELLEMKQPPLPGN